MEYLIALIPALGWGLMPLITGEMGGSEANQISGLEPSFNRGDHRL